jgi:hypothetical protein
MGSATKQIVDTQPSSLPFQINNLEFSNYSRLPEGFFDQVVINWPNWLDPFDCVVGVVEQFYNFEPIEITKSVKIYEKKSGFQTKSQQPLINMEYEQ